jgi:hypothetical protein
MSSPGVPQPPQSPGLDLANAFARDVELISDLLQRAGLAAIQPKPQA